MPKKRKQTTKHTPKSQGNTAPGAIIYLQGGGKEVNLEDACAKRVHNEITKEKNDTMASVSFALLMGFIGYYSGFSEFIGTPKNVFEFVEEDNLNVLLGIMFYIFTLASVFASPYLLMRLLRNFIEYSGIKELAEQFYHMPELEDEQKITKLKQEIVAADTTIFDYRNILFGGVMLLMLIKNSEQLSYIIEYGRDYPDKYYRDDNYKNADYNAILAAVLPATLMLSSGVKRSLELEFSCFSVINDMLSIAGRNVSVSKLVFKFEGHEIANAIEIRIKEPKITITINKEDLLLKKAEFKAILEYTLDQFNEDFLLHSDKDVFYLFGLQAITKQQQTKLQSTFQAHIKQYNQQQNDIKALKRILGRISYKFNLPSWSIEHNVKELTYSMQNWLNDSEDANYSVFLQLMQQCFTGYFAIDADNTVSIRGPITAIADFVTRVNAEIDELFPKKVAQFHEESQKQEIIDIKVPKPNYFTEAEKSSDTEIIAVPRVKREKPLVKFLKQIGFHANKTARVTKVEWPTGYVYDTKSKYNPRQDSIYFDVSNNSTLSDHCSFSPQEKIICFAMNAREVHYVIFDLETSNQQKERSIIQAAVTALENGRNGKSHNRVQQVRQNLFKLRLGDHDQRYVTHRKHCVVDGDGKKHMLYSLVETDHDKIAQVIADEDLHQFNQDTKHDSLTYFN